MKYVEKQVVLQSLDHLWREHLVTLDHLRQVIGWRGYAQRDPLNEYTSPKPSSFSTISMTSSLREQVTAQLMRVEVMFEAPRRARAATDAGNPSRSRYRRERDGRAGDGG